MYLTHEEYTAMGGSIDAALFPRFEAKARMYIDVLTHGRLCGETEARENVRFCMYDLITAMHADESASGAPGREIASMSNDGVSVAYASGNGTGTASARYTGIVRTWLLNEAAACGIPLMYAGVDV